MDPLEDVLALLDTRAYVSSGLLAGGAWAVRFPAPDGAKFNTVRRGGCLLAVDGVPEPLPLAEGDCFLLTRRRRFTLCSGPDVRPVPAEPLFAAARDGVARTGDGEEVSLVGGGFSFGDRAQELLLDALPPVVHVPADAGQAEPLRWALATIDTELRQRHMGSRLVAEHLAVVMLVQVLRLHLARAPRTVSGWLAGLTDPVTAVALAAMHEQPAHPWTVAELARAGSVSRSTLAARFKRTVGQGPLEYLTGWRIALAARQLATGATLASTAHTVGYGSESALSTAFRRVTGTPPGEYRRRMRRL